MASVAIATGDTASNRWTTIALPAAAPSIVSHHKLAPTDCDTVRHSCVQSDQSEEDRRHAEQRHYRRLQSRLTEPFMVGEKAPLLRAVPLRARDASSMK